MFVRCPGCQAAYRLEAEQIPAAGLRVRCPGCGNVFRVRGVESVPAVTLATPALGIERPEFTRPELTRPDTRPELTRPDTRPELTRPATPSASPQSGSSAQPSQDSAAPLDLERDTRLPPRAAPPRPLPTQKVTPRPLSGGLGAPPATPPARRPQWQGERTLELGSTGTASAPPRLETAPFKPGMAPIPPAPRPRSGSEIPRPTASAAAHERARRLARALVSDILVYNQSARDRALQQGNLSSALGGEVNKAWDMYKAKVDADVLRSTSYFKDALNEILADGQIVF
jgi:predicted Zn finger-like uncharacterized protein